jgi:putative hemolysin
MPLNLLEQAHQGGAFPPKVVLQSLLRRLSPLERVNEIYQRALHPADRSILENVLAEMRVQYQVTDADLERVPATGPAIITANHPFGLLDGAVLGALLGRVRTDIKLLTNFILASVPELREHCIFVDPFGGSDAVSRNRPGIKETIGWLAKGGMLIVFPAGEVSHLRFQDFGIVDAPWNSMVARMAMAMRAPVVPVFIPGCNSATFQALGMVHPKLRTAWLLNEFLQQRDKTVEVRIGKAIPPEALRGVGSHEEVAAYLRWRTYILAQRGRKRTKSVVPVLTAMLPQRRQQPAAGAIQAERLADELEMLRPEQRLIDHGEFTAYCGRASEFPAVMQEVGRLREVTFREAGEGTGKSRDLDGFDDYYTHLVLWNLSKREIVGAYRLGLTSEVLPRLGIAGLYTSTLFRYREKFFQSVGPAVELGRSFVRIEYQKQYAPLLILWKAIGRYIALHPEVAVLFGAVSVSDRYSRFSRELIYHFFQRQEKDELASLVAPRNPFRFGPRLPSVSYGFCDSLRDLDYLADPIADVEDDGKGVPVLIRHYVRLGGRMLSFNVDRHFSNVLDGLVLMDLRRSDPTLLRRYMSDAELEAFRSYHGLVCQIPAKS